MYSQLFTAKELYNCTTQSERRSLGIKKDLAVVKIKNQLEQLGGVESFCFSVEPIQEYYVNAQEKGSFKYFMQELISRKIHRNIKRIYGVRQANRNSVVKILCTLLQEDTPIWIVRSDVKHFYESIDCNDIIKKFEQDARLTKTTITLLKHLLDSCGPVNGLPRGLAVSAAMSELYMRYFDYEISRVEGVYYYARFVDDIVVLCTNENSQKVIKEKICTELERYKLEMNADKTFLWNSENNTEGRFEYLGYAFEKIAPYIAERKEVDSKRKKANKKKLEVSIASEKIKKIKTRLTRSFLDYGKKQNFDLLKKRIKFLTGNTVILNHASLLPVKIGIYYNYKYGTPSSRGILMDLKNLDLYYQKILHCKRGRMGSKIHLNRVQMSLLEKLSFQAGFCKKITYRFKGSDIKQIKQCWL